MTTPTEALKPCPFCGHKTPYFERQGTPRQSCIVACGNCGARHESSDEDERSGRSWNTRAALLEQALTDHDIAQMMNAASLQGGNNDSPWWLRFARAIERRARGE